jgi:hypothetical protein
LTLLGQSECYRVQKKSEKPEESSGLQVANSYEILNQYNSGKIFLKVLPFEQNGGQ